MQWLLTGLHYLLLLGESQHCFYVRQMLWWLVKDEQEVFVLTYNHFKFVESDLPVWDNAFISLKSALFGYLHCTSPHWLWFWVCFTIIWLNVLSWISHNICLKSGSRISPQPKKMEPHLAKKQMFILAHHHDNVEDIVSGCLRR